MYTQLLIAFILLGTAFLLSTWTVIQTEKFIDSSGATVDASGAALGDRATSYLTNLLNSVFPKIKFSSDTDSITEPDITDRELVQKYLRNDMAKLLKEEVIQLRRLVPVPSGSIGGVSPSLAQGVESAARPL